MLKNFTNHLSSVVFPAHCLQCETPLPTGAPRQWCNDCFHNLVGDEGETCQQCGARLRQPSPFETECQFCRDLNFRFDSAVSIGNYCGNLQSTVLEMKRCKCEATAFQLGTLLGDLIGERSPVLSADLLLPIPIHWWSRMKRGFCAASMIAAGIAAKTQIPIDESVIRQTRKTKKQGMLSNTARFQNVRGAFSVVKPQTVVGKTVFVVDDVMTSGATANEAAKILKKAGANRVYIAVASRGVRAS